MWVASATGPRGAEEGTSQDWPYAARDTRTLVSARVFAVGRGDGFVVLAEVTARAAGELCLADGGPVWVTVEATGWPATGLNSIGPGVWARPAAWYYRSCPECDESSALPTRRVSALSHRSHGRAVRRTWWRGRRDDVQVSREFQPGVQGLWVSAKGAVDDDLVQGALEEGELLIVELGDEQL
jgi:hypothetical protein